MANGGFAGGFATGLQGGFQRQQDQRIADQATQVKEKMMAQDQSQFQQKLAADYFAKAQETLAEALASPTAAYNPQATQRITEAFASQMDMFDASLGTNYGAQLRQIGNAVSPQTGDLDLTANMDGQGVPPMTVPQSGPQVAGAAPGVDAIPEYDPATGTWSVPAAPAAPAMQAGATGAPPVAQPETVAPGVSEVAQSSPTQSNPMTPDILDEPIRMSPQVKVPDNAIFERHYGYKIPSGKKILRDVTGKAIFGKDGKPVAIELDPQMSADIVAKLASVDNQLVKMEQYMPLLMSGELSSEDQTAAWLHTLTGGMYREGKYAEALSNIKESIEVVLRAMTGAAAPEQEVTRYDNFFMPKPWDSVETRRMKAFGLRAFMKQYQAIAEMGRGGNPALREYNLKELRKGYADLFQKNYGISPDDFEKQEQARQERWEKENGQFEGVDYDTSTEFIPTKRD